MSSVLSTAMHEIILNYFHIYSREVMWTCQNFLPQCMTTVSPSLRPCNSPGRWTHPTMRLTLKSAAVDPLKFSKYLNRLLVKQIQNAYLEVPILHGI